MSRKHRSAPAAKAAQPQLPSVAPFGGPVPPEQGQYAEIGVSGLRVWSGVVDEEFLRVLRGERGRKIFREMSQNDATIGAILAAIGWIIRAVEWRAEPADESEKAKAEAEFVESVFKDMSHTWSSFMDEVMSLLVFGWQYSEVVWKKRLGPEQDDPSKRSEYDDGRIGIRKIAPRSQDTLLRWEMQDDGGVSGLWQQPPLGGPPLFIPIERALLFRTTSRLNSPEGVSILRTAYESWYFLKRVREYEAVGIERELAGLPIVRIPGKYTKDDATAQEKALYEQFKTIARDLKFNQQGGLVIPSDFYLDKDGFPITGARLVDIELIKSAGTRTIDTTAVKNDYKRDMTRSVLADFLMLGQDKGAYNLGAVKTDLFFKAVAAILDQVASPINRFAIPRLWEMNGLPRETMPQMAPKRIADADLAKIGAFLRDASAAGMPLFPDDNLEAYLRSEANLPEKSPEAQQAQDEQAAIDAENARLGLEGQRQTVENGGVPPGKDKGGQGNGGRPFGKRRGTFLRFDPDEPRDDRGEWTASGGGASDMDAGEPNEAHANYDSGETLPPTVFRGGAHDSEYSSSWAGKGVYVSASRASAAQWGDVAAYDLKRQPKLLDLGHYGGEPLAMIRAYNDQVDGGWPKGHVPSRSEFDDVAGQVFIQMDDPVIGALKRKGYDGARLGPDAFLIGKLSRHAKVKKAFDPSEPRDDHGMWTDGGGGGADAYSEDPREPVHAALNKATHEMTRAVLPNGYATSADAPSTFEDLVKSYRETGKLTVYDGASDKTIFADPEANYDFRAWHDATHLRLAAPFTAEGEHAVAVEQNRQLVERYGDTPRTRRMTALITAEIDGQVAYSKAHGGAFPVDQRAFDLAYLKDPDAAVHATFKAMLAKMGPLDWGRLRDEAAGIEHATFEASPDASALAAELADEHDAALAKFSPEQLRDYHGRWADAPGAGAGFEFVSPNVDNLDFARASASVGGERHQAIAQASREVDQALGLNARTSTVVGAWRDGAENSTVTRVEGASWDDLMASAAMKGYLAKQKQVLVFRDAPQGDSFLSIFEATGTLGDIHRHLLDNGLEFHTLEPTPGGAVVHVFGQDEQTARAVTKAGEHYGSQVTTHVGRGEFVGTTKQDGTDEEQRADARAVYAGVLSRSGSRRARAAWDGLRDRHARFDALKAALTRYDPSEARDERGRWTAGGGGGSRQARGRRPKKGHAARIKAFLRKPGLHKAIVRSAGAAAVSAGLMGLEAAGVHGVTHYALEHLGAAAAAGGALAPFAEGLVTHAVHKLGISPEKAQEWLGHTFEHLTSRARKIIHKALDGVEEDGVVEMDDEVEAFFADLVEAIRAVDVSTIPAAKYSPDQPRDEAGRWSETAGGGHGVFTGDEAATRDQLKAWADKATHRDLPSIMTHAPANQRELALAGEEVAAEVGGGVRFQNPGMKTKVGRIETKMRLGGKGPHEITDIVRTSFIVDTPEQGDAVVAALSKRYPVVDEGWRKTDMEYFDRPLKVRFGDGMIGEVQVVERNMSWAKSGAGGGGHHMYVAARDLPNGDARKRELTRSMRSLYASALSRAHPAFGPLLAKA